MTVHVGIYPHTGKISYYKVAEKRTIDLQISKKVLEFEYGKTDKIKSLFEEIKNKINEEIEFVCINLSGQCCNIIRKNFVKEALNCGFKDIKIINKPTAEYLNAMSQTSFRPLNGDVIWIEDAEEKDCFNIWKINVQKAEFFGYLRSQTSNELENQFHWFAVNKNLNGPNFLLHKRRIDETNIRRLSPTCQFYLFNSSNFETRGSLLKARIASRDQDVVHLETKGFLFNSIILRYRGVDIKTFNGFPCLPQSYSQTLSINSGYDVLGITTRYVFNEFGVPPNTGEYEMTFEIDENEIYSVTFADNLNYQDSNSESTNITSASNTSNDASIMSQLQNPMINFFEPYQIPLFTTPINTDINVIGIDLGTSRCCAAVNRRNAITTIPLDNNGERLLPSYIAYDEENAKCGKVVVNRCRYHAKSTIFDSKRIIGRMFSDIEIDSNWGFGITSENENVFLKVQGNSGEKVVSAEQAAAELLKHIKKRCEEFQGKTITEAVITVPAAFTDSQKDATMEAVRLAGLDKAILFPEPIAAAFAYFIARDIPNNSTLLLFDMGGGTLDVCVFKIETNQLHVISNTGDTKLGGRNFDTVLMNYFKSLLNTRYGISVLKDKKYKLMLECQKIKEDLSVIPETSMDVSEYDTTKTGRISISRENFQRMTHALLNQVKTAIHAALFESNLTPNQINKVLLVGGGSRMPMVKQLLSDTFPRAEQCCEEHPDEVVALGAAYYAYNIVSN